MLISMNKEWKDISHDRVMETWVDQVCDLLVDRGKLWKWVHLCMRGAQVIDTSARW